MKKTLQIVFFLASAAFLFYAEPLPAQSAAGQQQQQFESLGSLLDSKYLNSKPSSMTQASTEVKQISADVLADIGSPAFKSDGQPLSSQIRSVLKSGSGALVDNLVSKLDDPNTASAVKEAVNNLLAGKSVDFKQVVSTVAQSQADRMVDKTNLSANQKQLAHAAIAELAGEEGALLNATADHIQTKLVKAGIPADSAKNIAGNIRDFVTDTDNFAALRDASSELAQDLVTKYVGGKGAATINAAIEEYMSESGTLKSAAKESLNTAIDQYVRDPASNAALKKAVTDIESGKTPDCQAIGTALAKHGADKLIDNSKLSANEKALAHAAVSELAGEEGALLNATADHIQKKLIKAGVAEETAKSISGNIQTYLADTGNTAALQAAGSESLQALVTKCVDEKGAATINAGIREFMENKTGDLKNAAIKTLDTAIDQYVRDPASNAALKNALANLKEGEPVDYMEVGTALARHGADKLIDQSNLTANQKKLAHAAVAELAGEEGALINATTEHITDKLIKNGVDPEVAKSISGDLRSFLNDTNNTAALKNAASTSAQELVNRYVGGKGAEVINAGIRELMSENGTMKSTAEAALNSAIDTYVRDPASNAALKGVVSSLKDGKPVDYTGTVTTLARYGADSLIDKSNLSANEKALAHAAVAELAGEEGALINATAAHIEAKLIAKGVDPAKAKSISSNIQTYLADTGNTAALKAAATDAAQAIVSKYVGEKGAAVLNSAISEYMSEKGTAGSAAEAALDAAIDQYVKGDDAKKALKDAIRKSRNGEDVDYGEVGTTVFTSYAMDAIEKSKLSPEEKKLAQDALRSVNGEIPWSETGAEALEAVMVKAGLSQEQASELSRGIIDYFKGDTSLEKLADSAKTVFSSVIAKAIDKQLEKWEKKFPVLKKLYDFFGISRKDVVEFFRKLTVADIKAAFKKICNMSLEDWKNIGKQLLKKALDVAIKKLCKVLKKLSEKIIKKLMEKIEAKLKKIHFLEKYMGYVTKGVGTATDFLLKESTKLIDKAAEKAQEINESAWKNTPGAVNGN